MSPLELTANTLNAASIVLAGRHSLHTWWVGAIGCALFALLFFEARLYADMTLQAFFVVTSLLGWWRWTFGAEEARVVRHCTPAAFAALLAAAGASAITYGWTLYRFTDAYAPFADSFVLAFGVLGQFLLMDRRVESWWCWLAVNTIAVPLYLARDLHLTALFFIVTWINALVSLVEWRRVALRV
jgi:nicotinamide mononucleotide transporter